MRITRWPRQLKKYFWLSEIVFSGVTVACLPSTVTANVSGVTSIFGVPELRTMSRLPILRVFRDGHHLPVEAELLLDARRRTRRAETKVMQLSGSALPNAPNIGR